MKLSEVIFIDSFPTLDLHGYDRDSARVKINEFVSDNITMGKDIIVIVHGIGTGVLKAETQSTLKNNKYVCDYQIFRGNVGCTIAKLYRNI